MGYEISQFDILNRQLLASDPQTKVNTVWDIGEAEITRTIFGGAKVRVVRAQDRKRRSWLLAVLAAIAIAAASWQGWVIFQRIQHEAPPVPLSERIWVSAPVFQPAHIAPDPHPSRRKQESLIQSEINGLLSGPLPRHPPGWKPPAKPDTSGSSIENKPQVASVATIKNPSVTQTGIQQPDIQQPGNPSVAIQSEAKALTATPKPAANQPAGVVPLADPLVKGDASTPSSTGSDQPPGPVKAQD
jgi:hypothetical protein